MTSIVIGGGLGVVGSSATQVNGYGASGQGKVGQGNDLAIVNAATGNLIIQSQDDFVASKGIDDALLRTYNSQGILDGDNNDGWRVSLYRSLTINGDGTLTRTSADGHQEIFTGTGGVWRSNEGEAQAAHDAIRSISSPLASVPTEAYEYEAGGSNVFEMYDSSGKLLGWRDTNNNVTTLTYTGSLVTGVSDSSGQTVTLNYVGNNLQSIQINARSPGASTLATQTRVTYTYDAQNRLSQVRVDLTPQNTGDSSFYYTTYLYDGTSDRVTKITQSTDQAGVNVNNSLSISYVQQNGVYRVFTLSDATNRSTQFHYDLVNGRTDVTDSLGNATSYYRDIQGRLVSVLSPDMGGGKRTLTSYQYDVNNNIVAVTDADGRAVHYAYDANGNVTEIRDQTGNTVRRIYDANDNLLAETVFQTKAGSNFTGSDASSPLTTHYAYDTNQRLSFIVTPEGRVTRYVYDAAGQRTSTLTYTGTLYSTASSYSSAPAFPLATGFDFSSLNTWATSTADKSKIERSDIAYDLTGQVQTVTTYQNVDASGVGVAANSSTTRYVYDFEGRLLMQIDPRASSAILQSTTAYSSYSFQGTQFVTSYAYDGLDRQIKMQSAQVSGASTISTLTSYDDANNKITVTSASNFQTVTTFNKSGDKLSVTNTGPNSGALGTTNYYYDANGWLRMTQDPTGAKSFYFWDAQGRQVGVVKQVTVIDPVTGVISVQGELIETVYDEAGQQLKQIQYASRISSTVMASLIDGSGNPVLSADLFTVRGGTRPDIAPAIDLDSTLTAGGRGYRVTYSAPGTAVAAVSSAALSVIDTSNITSAQVILGGAIDGSAESLAVTVSGGLTASYNSSTGILTISGSASAATYQTVLRTLTYRNVAQVRTVGDRTLDVTVTDGLLNSNITTSVVTVAKPALPVVDLNGAVTGTGYTATFTENGGPVSMVDSINLKVTAAGDANLLSAAITLTNRPDGIAESLGVSLGSSGLSASYNSSTGVLLINGTATAAVYQSVLSTLTYNNTSQAPATTTRSINVVVNDGQQNSAAATSQVSITAVNNAPLVLGVGSSAAAFTEGGAAVAVAPGIILSDADSANLSSATVAIANLLDGTAESLAVTVGTTGLLASYDSGTGILTITGSASQASYQTVLRSLVYNNASATPSTTSRAVTIKVNDGVADSNIVTSLVTVTPTYTAPVLTGGGNTTAFTEGGGAVTTNISGLAITDLDSPNLLSATVTLTNRPDGPAESLSVDLSGTTGLVQSYDSSTGILTILGAASQSVYQTLLSSKVKYNNTSQNPTTTNRTISVMVNDGQQNSSAVVTQVSVAAVNNAPVADLSGSGVQSATNIITPASSSGSTTQVFPLAQIFDLDSAGLSSATISLVSPGLGANITLTVPVGITGVTVTGSGGTTITISTIAGNTVTAAQYAQILRALKFNSGLIFTSIQQINVTLNDGIAAGVQSKAFVVPGLFVSVAPTIAGNTTAAFVEGAGPINVSPALTVTNLLNSSQVIYSATVWLPSDSHFDGDSETLAVNVGTTGLLASYNSSTGELIISGAASIGTYQSVLRTVTYNNTSQNPTTTARSVRYTATDGKNVSTSVWTGITVTAVNTVPLVTGVGTSAAAFTEGGAAVAAAPGITLSDADSANLTSATGAITNLLDGAAESLAVTVGASGLTASYDSNTGILTLSGSASQATYQTVLRTLVYSNSSQTPNTAAPRVLSIKVNDGSADSNVATTLVTVASINTPPVLSGGGNTSVFTEGGGAVTVGISGASINDVDSPNLLSATVTLTNRPDGAAESLSVDLTGTTGLAQSYDSSTGTLTIIGAASPAVYQALLAGNLRYNNTSQNPTVISRTLSAVVNDGQQNSGAVTSQISITPVNAAPTVALSSSAIPLSNNGQVTFAGIGTQTVLSASGTISDVDSPSLNSLAASISNPFGTEGLSLIVPVALQGLVTVTGNNTASLTITVVAGNQVTPTQWTSILRALIYNNSVAVQGYRQIKVAMNDGALTSTPSSVFVIPAAPITYTSPTSYPSASAVTAVTGGGASVTPVLASASDRISKWLYDRAGRLIYTIDAAGYATQYSYDGAGRKIAQTEYANALLAGNPVPANGQSEGFTVPVDAGGKDRTTRYFYDGDNRSIATLDAAGYLTENIYDAAGQLTKTIGYATITASAQRASGSLTALRPATDANNDHVSYFFYNAEGQLTTQIDPNGDVSAFQYTLAGQQSNKTQYYKSVSYNGTLTISQIIAAATVPVGTRVNDDDQNWSWSYDALGRVTQQIDNQGTVTQYVYDSVTGFLTSQTSAYGTSDARTTSYQYDDLGRVTNALSGLGSASLATNSAAWNVDGTATAYGHKTIYDLAGRKIETVDPNGHTTFYYYNQDSQLVYTVDGTGAVTQSVYDAFGEVKQVIQYNQTINNSALKGGLLSDSANAAFVSTITAASFRSDANNRITNYAYNDSRGLLTQATDALGFSTTNSYDAFGDLITQVVDVSTNGTPGTTTRTDQYQYDNRGLKTQGVQDSGVLNITTKILQYDAFGRATQMQDANGNITTAAYNDHAGRIVTITDPLSKTTVTTYDAFGRTISLTDRNGNTTGYSYTDGAQKMTITTPEGVVTSIVTNRFGQKISVTTGSAVDSTLSTTTYAYDKDGNLTSTVVDQGAGHLNFTTSNTYDNADLLTKTVDANLTPTTYAYDAANRVLTRIVDPVSLNPTTGLNLPTQYVYNAFGQAYQVIDANGVTTETVFDKKGESTAVIVDAVDASGQPGTALKLATLYTYDARGLALTVQEGMQASGSTGSWTFSAAANTTPKVTQYVYDKAGRRTSQVVDPGAGKLNITTLYAYDKNGNVVRKTDANGNVWRSLYNAGGQLIYSVDPLGDVTQSWYDVEGRVIESRKYATPSTATLTDLSTASSLTAPTNTAQDQISWMVYDKDGRKTFDVQSLDGTNASVVGYVYDKANRVVDTIRYFNTVNISSGLPANFTAPGASGQDEHAHTVYDLAGRAIYTIDALNDVTRYAYDKNGNVIKKYQYANQPASGIQYTSAWLSNSTNLAQNTTYDRVTRYVYDAAGRQTYTLKTITGSDTSYTAYLTETDYDNVGRVATTIAYANSAAFTSDVVSLSSAQAAVTLDADDDQITYTSYFATGLVQSVTDAEGYAESYTYDGVGNQISLLNKLGNLWTYQYDAAGRMIEEDTPIVATQLNSSQTPTGIYGAQASVVSADGKQLYVLGAYGASVAVFNRAVDGTLTFVQSFQNGQGGVQGLASASALALSTDGQNLYVTGPGDNSLVVFSRNPTTGGLTYLQTLKEGINGVTGLATAYDVCVSPDGKNVYVAGYSDSAISVFNRNAVTGALTFNQVIQNGSGISTLTGVRALTISADGTQLYAVSSGSNSVDVFSRNATTGQLSLSQELINGAGGITGLSQPAQITLSADGNNVYVAAVGGGILQFSRSSAGALTYQQTYTNGAGGATGFWPFDIVISHDGKNAYAVNTYGNNVGVFSRDTVTGNLTYISSISQSDLAGVGLSTPLGISMSPDDSTVYVESVNDSSVTVFSRDQDGSLREVGTLQNGVLTRYSIKSSIATKIIYDGLGNVLEKIENAGAADKTQSRVTSFKYDALGRQVRSVNGDIYYDAVSGNTYGCKVGVYNAAADDNTHYGSSLDPNVASSISNRTGFESVQAIVSDTFYDALGNAIAGRVLTGVNSLGNPVYSYSYKIYDASRRLAYEIDANRNVTRYTYDSYGNQSTLTRFNSPAIVDATDGSLLALETSLNTAVSSSGTGSAPANSAALLAQQKMVALVAVINATNSRQITMTYDQLNRKVLVEQPATDYYVTSVSGAVLANTAGQQQVRPTAFYRYDAFNDLTLQSSLLAPQPSQTTLNPLAYPQDWATSYFGYDRLGNQTDVADALNYYTNNQYDAFGRLTQNYQYAKAMAAAPTGTAVNNVVPGWVFTAPTALTPGMNAPAGYDRITGYAYDRMNRQVSVTKSNTVFSDLVAGHNTVTNSDTYSTYADYDALGNLIASTDAEGNITRSYYDELGRLIATAAPTRISQGANQSVSIREAGIQYQAVTVTSGKTSVTHIYASWDSLNSWGNGDVKIIITYVNVLGQTSTSTVTRSSAQGDSGGEFTINGVFGSGLAASSIVKVVVQKNVNTAISPNWVQAYDSTSPVQYQIVSKRTGSFGGPANNVVTASWSSLQGMGSGDVRATIKYYSNALSTATGTQTMTVSSAQGDAGVTFSWSSDILYAVTEIIVEKNIGTATSPNWVRVYDTNGTKRQIEVGSLPILPAGASVQLSYVSTTNPAISGNVTLQQAGGFWIGNFPVALFVTGTYNYTLSAKNSSGAVIDLVTNDANQTSITGQANASLTSGNPVFQIVGASTSVTPLTTMAYDALGNMVSQDNWANGATDASLSGFISGAKAAQDQISYKRYDILGRVIETIDANGHSAFQSYDAMGHVVRSWQALTELYVGAQYASAIQQTTLYQYDATGRQTATVQVVRLPDDAASNAYTLQATTAKYNAFGEQIATYVTANSSYSSGTYTYDQTNDLTEYADYDSNGGVWQTNAKDGIDKVYRYDLFGNQTALITVPNVPATPGAALTAHRLSNLSGLTGLSSLLETDTVYDNLGRSIKQTQQSFTQTTSDSVGALGVPQVTAGAGVSFSGLSATSNVSTVLIFQRQQYYSYTLNVAWGSLAQYGNVALSVVLTYTLSDGTTGTKTLSIPSSLTMDSGGVLAWDGDKITTTTTSTATAPQITGITSITVKYGSAVVRKTSSPTSASFIELAVPKTLTGVTFNGNFTIAGLGAFPSWSVVSGTNIYQVSVAAGQIPDGTYQYSYTLQDNLTTPVQVYGTYTGTVTVTGGYAVFGPASPATKLLTPTITQTLDRWGNVLTSTDPRSADANAVEGIYYRYNDKNQVIYSTPLENTLGGPAVAKGTSETGVDVAVGASQYSYDARGNLIQTIDAAGNVHQRAYDNDGQLSVEYDFTSATASYTTLHLYDALGRQAQTIDANGNITSYAYDRLNRLTTQTNSALQGQNSPVYAYTYDEAGNRRTSTDGISTEITQYRYNTLGQLITELTPLANSMASNYKTSYLYDVYGNKIQSIDGNAAAGNSVAQTWLYDWTGRLLSNTDLGGAQHASTYDEYGRLKTVTDPTHGASLTYAYYQNGWLKTIADNTNDTVTYYEYDDAGHHTREMFITDASTTHAQIYQDARLAYDSQGRLTSDRDIQSYTTYKYDVVGNRREISTKYQKVGSSSSTTYDYWYTYDQDNRILIAEGSLQSGAIVISSAQGSKLSYDGNGNRRTDETYQGGHVYLTYTYDPENRLVNTFSSTIAGNQGNATSSRLYDQAGRVTQYQEYNSAGTAISGTDVYVYNVNGWLLQQKHLNSGGSVQYAVGYYLNATAAAGYDDDTEYFGKYDATVTNNPLSTETGLYDYDGNLKKYFYVSGSTTISYKYTYAHTTGYQVTQIHAFKDSSHKGDTVETYDSNNNLITLVDTYNSSAPTRNYVVNTQGQILYRADSNNKTQNYFFANGMQVGSVGTIDSAKFDFNYTPVSSTYPSTVPGQYVLQDGDTLESIAFNVFGDSSLWYLIADANGLSSNSDLNALADGTTLKIPNSVTNIHNNSNTFKPYDPNKAIGDTTPTVKPPPSPRCKTLSNIIGAIVAIVVTVVIAVFTVGIGASAGAAIGAAAGDEARQFTYAVANNQYDFRKGLGGLPIALFDGDNPTTSIFAPYHAGFKEGYDYGSTVIAGAAGFVGGSVGKLASPYVGEIAGGAVGSASANAVTQGINIALNRQDGFSWRQLAASAASGAAGSAVAMGAGQVLNGLPAWANTAGATFASGVARAAVYKSIDSHGTIAWIQIAVDSFGNALANSTVRAMMQSDSDKQQAQNRLAEMRVEMAQEEIARTGGISTPSFATNIGSATSLSSGGPSWTYVSADEWQSLKQQLGSEGYAEGILERLGLKIAPGDSGGPSTAGLLPLLPMPYLGAPTPVPVHAKTYPSTGTIGADPGLISNLSAIGKAFFNGKLTTGDALSMAWGQVGYGYRGSDTAQGLVQVASGIGEVAGAIGITASTGGAGAIVGVPIAFHGGDNIGTGLDRISYGDPQQTATYAGMYALTGSPAVAHAVDMGIPLLGGAVGLSAFGPDALSVVKFPEFTPQGLQLSADQIAASSQGMRLLGELQAADPSAAPEVIFSRAQQLIASGNELPRPVPAGTGDTFYKLVPTGQSPSDYSPFFVSERGYAALQGVPAAQVPNVLGLPQSSVAASYDVFSITPNAGVSPTVFDSVIAPTSEGYVRYTGGFGQSLIPNRQLFTPSVYVGPFNPVTTATTSDPLLWGLSPGVVR